MSFESNDFNPMEQVNFQKKEGKEATIIEKGELITLKDGTKVEITEIDKAGDTVLVKSTNANGQLIEGRMMAETLKKAKEKQYVGINDEVTTKDGNKVMIEEINRELGMAKVKGVDVNGKPINGQMFLNKLELKK